ncbi:MAG: thioredoxin family protein [Spirochaetales bacterium]|nr:thioredoxin family protein [Spirochaetales bacterium]
MTKRTISNIIFYGGLAVLVAGFFIYSAVVKNSSEIIESDDSFLLEQIFDRQDGVVLAQKPSVVIFYSPSCPACKMIDPFLKDLSNDFKDEVAFYRVNVAQNRFAASLFDLKGVPSVVFAKPGKTLDELTITTGFRTKMLLKGHVKDMLD